MAWWHRFWRGWGVAVTSTTPAGPDAPTPWAAPNYVDSLGGYGPPSFNNNQFPGTNHAASAQTVLAGGYGRRGPWGGWSWFGGAPGPLPQLWSPDYHPPLAWLRQLAGVPANWRPGMPGAAVFNQFGQFLRWDANDSSPYGSRVEMVTHSTPAPEPSAPAGTPWHPTPFTQADFDRMAQMGNIPVRP